MKNLPKLLGKNFLIVGIMMLLILISNFTGSNLISSGSSTQPESADYSEIWSQNFESDSAEQHPSGWTVYDGSSYCEIKVKAPNMGWSTKHINFCDHQYGYLTQGFLTSGFPSSVINGKFSFDFMIYNDGYSCYYDTILEDSSQNDIITIRLHDTGSTGQVSINGYVISNVGMMTIHSLIVEFDLGLIDIILDNVVVLNDISYTATPMTGLRLISQSPGYGGGIMYDNFRLEDNIHNLPPLTAPILTEYTKRSDDGVVVLNWVNMEDIIYYNIYRDDVPILSTYGLVKIAETTNHYYVDSGLVDGSIYFYAITAVNEYGESEVSSWVKSIISIPIPIWTQDFNDNPTNQPPIGWTIAVPPSSNIVVTAPSSGFSTNFLTIYSEYQGPLSMNAYLNEPLPAILNGYFSMDFLLYDGYDNGGFHLMFEQNDGFSIIDLYCGVNLIYESGTYIKKGVVGINEYRTTNIEIGTKHSLLLKYYDGLIDVFVDNVEIISNIEYVQKPIEKFHIYGAPWAAAFHPKIAYDNFIFGMIPSNPYIPYISFSEDTIDSLITSVPIESSALIFCRLEKSGRERVAEFDGSVHMMQHIMYPFGYFAPELEINYEFWINIDEPSDSFHININQGDFIRIYQQRLFYNNNFDSQYETIQLGEWLHIRMMITGNQLFIYLNQIQIFENPIIMNSIGSDRFEIFHSVYYGGDGSIYIDAIDCSLLGGYYIGRNLD